LVSRVALKANKAKKELAIKSSFLLLIYLHTGLATGIYKEKPTVETAGG
jgi:hypothetical protein